jgi:hypothetical protein
MLFKPVSGEVFFARSLLSLQDRRRCLKIFMRGGIFSGAKLRAMQRILALKKPDSHRRKMTSPHGTSVLRPEHSLF